MVLFNYAIREITAKIVYYGPGLGGKTTNLQFIHSQIDAVNRGKLLSLATDSDRTLFFDFLPLDLGKIGGYRVRFQLYTVPGQVHYNATRKLVLKGVDAVVFVADSQIEMMERNRESFDNLAENLSENGYEMSRIPIVIQLNKRDLTNVASPSEIIGALGGDSYQKFEAVATRGEGVFETLKAIIKLTIYKLKKQFESAEAPLAEEPVRPPSPPIPVSEPAPVSGAGADAEPLRSQPPREVSAEEIAPKEVGSFEEEEAAIEAGGGDRAETVEEVLPEKEVIPQEEVAALAGESTSRAETVEEVDLEEFGRTGSTTPAETLPPPAPIEDETMSLGGLASRVEEILGEIQRLREENREIKALLGRVFEGIDRQIEAWQQSKEELAKGIDRRAPESEEPHEKSRRARKGELF